MTIFPRWVQADSLPFTEALRVETKAGVFVDYMRLAGVWRQHTHPMTAAESVTPAKHMLGDWRDGRNRFPQVDDSLAAWLETTYRQIGGAR